MKDQIGKKIRELRKRKGMTQSELAALLNISPSAVGMYEQGRREPDSEMLVKIGNLFDVSADYLLGNPDPAQPKSREVTDIFDEFTGILTSQEGLMFDGVPLSGEERQKIVDALRVVAALARQQRRESMG